MCAFNWSNEFTYQNIRFYFVLYKVFPGFISASSEYPCSSLSKVSNRLVKSLILVAEKCASHRKAATSRWWFLKPEGRLFAFLKHSPHLPASFMMWGNNYRSKKWIPSALSLQAGSSEGADSKEHKVRGCLPAQTRPQAANPGTTPAGFG